MPDRRDITITYLRQRERPRYSPQPKPPGKVSILRAENPPIHFYRYLYDLVGRPWHWVTRKKLSDHDLAAIIHDPRDHLYVLYAGGVPAGMGEVDATKSPITDIRFFGLAPDYIGKGFGRYFLANIIDLAWATNPGEVRIETCTLDHPAALPLYQKFGFAVFDQQRGAIDFPVREDQPSA
ncbi:MAG: GNAT family N-acetyltransferase [Parvularculaceae bacterium]|nr:GNAT family N-acetyltransferase [Parvularculaceae bacterium]